MKKFLASTKYLEFVQEYGRIPTKEEFVDEMKLCGKTWYYELRKKLKEEVKEILQEGEVK